MSLPWLAFIPIPATLDDVILSPTFIGPFSVETFAGTRPRTATGISLLFSMLYSVMSVAKVPIIPGLVE